MVIDGFEKKGEVGKAKEEVRSIIDSSLFTFLLQHPRS